MRYPSLLVVLLQHCIIVIARKAGVGWMHHGIIMLDVHIKNYHQVYTGRC